MGKNNTALKELAQSLQGDVYDDYITRTLYATDASAYKELPVAVARPKNTDDIKKLIDFARINKLTLIPRTAGTSLAGQVVGNGIVVDVSRYMNDIIEFNEHESWVRVQPGVVLDELNLYLKPYGLFFSPETSTSNRCMIAGMVGNNACGAHSLIYGSTRDHLISVRTLLSDGSEVEFKPLDKKAFFLKTEGINLESRLYKHIYEVLSESSNQEEIRNEFPDSSLERRNSGYALDLLLETEPFTGNDKPFNFSKLIAGSEGTLALITEIKLNLVPLPPKHKGLICVHLNTLEDALQANLICLKYKPGAIELMDDNILERTKANIEQRKNRFFIQGDPGAIIIVEFARDSMEEIQNLRDKIIQDLTAAGYGYHFPLITGDDINKVWALRKAGLGVLTNIPGDAKPVSLVEDTAVKPELLPDYIKEFKDIMASYNLSCVYHAHIATGELHLRPILNLKDEKDVQLFRKVGEEVAHLVKKYRGSLSGEHGDGRLRGEFIPIIVGMKNYQLMKELKEKWDPDNIFNAGKIVNTPPMDTNLRYEPGKITREFETIFDFSSTQGMLRMAEMCNGSGDCRKSALMGGTMCPSYQASREEKTTTRARANALREYLTNPVKTNPVNIETVKEILDLCLSCKGCKSECPSNVDMAKLKAEFLQHYYDKKGVPYTAWLIANLAKIQKVFSVVPFLYNGFLKMKPGAWLLKKIMGFAQQRTVPLLSRTSFRRWLKKNLDRINAGLDSNDSVKDVVLFIDEFTNYLESEIGITTVKLLNRLGYKIHVVKHMESGRTYLSKGLLRQAKKIANHNIRAFSRFAEQEIAVVGIEPSAILAFRDEYPDLVDADLHETACKLAPKCMLIDEFLANEYEAGRIDRDIFTKEEKSIKFHGHCQQKAITSTIHTQKMLSIPANYKVEEIKSGCCGMAGAYGFEKRHYDLSMKIGELVLFPEIRQSSKDTIIVAPGTSCRDQIKDGTNVNALHPVQVLYEALV
ncbi:MAG: FAD-binding protein [Bacteroidales bacterium]|nr:FAD-binding protein [Bacteroidales bacterium]